jgi:PAS domain S-box-containing protein
MPPSAANRSASLADEQFLAELVKNSDYAIVAKDLHGKILFWNDAATKMYGYTAEEAVGQQIEIIIPEACRGDELVVRKRIAEGYEVHHTETERVRKDGQRIIVSFSTSPVVRDGQIVAAAGFARDITADVRARDEAFETQERLAAIVEMANDAIVVKNLDSGEILSWNKAATKMYGYTAEEAIGESIDLVVPEDRVEEEREIRNRIVRGAPVQQYGTIRQHKDGRRVLVSLSISPVKNAAGQITVAAGFASNEEVDRQAAIVKNAQDAIVLKNLDTGLIEGWNDAATAMYGYTAEEAIGSHISKLIPERLRDEDVNTRRKIKEGIRIEPHETERVKKDGTPIYVSLSIAPLYDETGVIRWAARIARDISESKRLQREREHATKMLQQFVGFTAHDFKMPIHQAKIHAQEARRALGPDAPRNVLGMLDIVISNTDWVSKRTQGLLKVATLDSRQTARKYTESAKAFDDSVAMLRSVDDLVEEADIVRSDLPRLRSNNDLLCFLFENFVQNACKYTRLGTRAQVRVSARRDRDAWEFSIADNGVGVSPGLEERIFEPYARDPAREQTAGLGIGLHFCKLIVEWHGGRIWVDKGPAGVGSTFKFTIPD